LAAAGYPVYASARKLEAIADLKTRGCMPIQLDVCDEPSMSAAVQRIEAEHGAVGVLVNNAGYGSEGPFEEVAMDEVRRQFETNVFGLIRLIQLVLPGMRRQHWGKIVNMSSVGGRLALPGGSFYHATKFGLEALSDALRFEVKGFGIDVIVVEPGAIKTAFGDTAIARVDATARPDSPYDEFRQGLKNKIREAYEGPMALLAGEADDVARVVERAIVSRRPRTRYPVTLGARVLLGLRRILPDRGFDAFLATQFKAPKA
jgi:NAD(P)-dependent dehydrogenase (short-subunit alcohol dehydrogenase family)